MRRLGAPGARYNKLDDADRERIIAMFGSGSSKAEIAAAIGCTTSGVYATLIKVGLHVAVRGRYRRNSPRLAAARAGLGG